MKYASKFGNTSNKHPILLATSAKTLFINIYRANYGHKLTQYYSNNAWDCNVTVDDNNFLDNFINCL